MARRGYRMANKDARAATMKADGWITRNYVRRNGKPLRIFKLCFAMQVQNQLRRESKRTMRLFALMAYNEKPDTGVALVATLRQGLR